MLPQTFTSICNSSWEIYEILTSGRLYYCSGKEKGSASKEANLIASERIEKDTTKGDLIYIGKTVTHI
jgi:hypothetical protein